MPLSFGKTSNIFDSLSVEFKEDINEEYFVKFHF